MSQLLEDLSNVAIPLELVDICRTDKAKTSILSIMEHDDVTDTTVGGVDPRSHVSTSLGLFKISPLKAVVNDNILIKNEE